MFAFKIVTNIKITGVRRLMVDVLHSDHSSLDGSYEGWSGRPALPLPALQIHCISISSIEKICSFSTGPFLSKTCIWLVLSPPYISAYFFEYLSALITLREPYIAMLKTFKHSKIDQKLINYISINFSYPMPDVRCPDGVAKIIGTSDEPFLNA